MLKLKIDEYETVVKDIFINKLNVFKSSKEVGFFVQYYLDDLTIHYTTEYHVNELMLHDSATKVADNCYKVVYNKSIYELTERNKIRNYNEYFKDYLKYRSSTNIDYFNISIPEFSYTRNKEVWKSIMGNVLKRDKRGIPLMTAGVMYNICNVRNDITDFLDGNNILRQYLVLFNKVETVGGIGTYYMNLEDTKDKFWGSDNLAKIFGMQPKVDNTYSIKCWKEIIYSYNKESGDKTYKTFKDFINGKSKELLITYDILVDGKKRVIKSHAIAQKRDDNRNVLVLLGSTKDITEIKEKEYELEKMAYTDLLTGLYNESKFTKDYNSKNLPYSSLLFLDINKFKQINDNYGHQFGDVAIKAFTDRIINSLKELGVNDYIMYRIYGDEFIINLDFDETMFNKYESGEIYNKLFARYSIEDTTLSIRFSMGVLTNFDINEKLEDTFRKIDVAMYLAKRNDKWYHIKDANKKDILDEEYFLELRIKTDLKEENIVPFFQPIYDITTNRINSFEALARINFEDVIIGPDKFLDVARRRKMLSYIDFTILKKSINSIMKLTEEGIIDDNVKIAVNFSMDTLNSPNLFKILKKIKSKTNFDYRRLKIEFTEAEITEMLKKEKIINKLKSMGINIVMDDFSAGNSSINTLTFDNMQSIKLDKKFLWEAMLNEDIKSMYKYFVLMFNKKRLEIVAEGVETKEQVRFLKEIGVANLQGYALSLPLANDDIKKVVLENSGIIEEVNYDYQKESVTFDNEIPSYNYEVDEELKSLWQTFLDQVICSTEFSTGLIARITDNSFQIFTKNTSDNNFELNQTFDHKSIFQEVIKSNDIFYIDDVRKSSKWLSNEIFGSGFLSCMGVSLKWPDGKYFGTIIFLGKRTSKSFLKNIKFTKRFIEQQLKQIKIRNENYKLKYKLNDTSSILKTIAKVGQVGIYILDMENPNNNYFNDELISILGISGDKETIMDNFPYISNDEESEKLFKNEIERISAISSGKLTKASGVVKIYNKRMNSIRYIKTSREVLDFMDAGLPRKIYCVVTDITDDRC